MKNILRCDKCGAVNKHVRELRTGGTMCDKCALIRRPLSKQQLASRHAAQAIAVGILMDQVRLMRKAGGFLGRAEAQAMKVEGHCQNVMNSLPTITSARGMKNIKAVCDEHASAFKAQFPELPGDSAMSAVSAIFTSHHAITELRRMHGLKTQGWIWLDQTATTLLGMMLTDLAEEENRMWEASLPVTEKIMEVAA
jgi:hypothetical protein